MDRFAAKKIRGFGTSVFAEMSRLAVQYDAVNLGQGFPDFPGPSFIKEAAKAAIDNDLNQYAVSHGAPRLRNAIAKTWSAQFGREIDPDREITVTSGATETIFDAIQAFLGPGDEVIAFEPFYDSYATSAILAGATLVPVTLRPPDWSFSLDDLKTAISSRTRVILLNTPHNPTGKVFTVDELNDVAALAIEHDLLVITDEVYDRITYHDAAHVSLATFPDMWDRTLTINSSGKTFSMTGWKIGFCIGPASLNAAVRSVHQYVTFASGTPFQDALALGYETADERGYYDTLASEYTARRDLLRTALNDAGLPTLPVSGSYFLMADFSHLPWADDASFCRFLATEVGVAAVPPSAFYADTTRAAKLARFCFAKKDETLKEAARRLQKLPELARRAGELSELSSSTKNS